jgi:hypothetical protein
MVMTAMLRFKLGPSGNLPLVAGLVGQLSPYETSRGLVKPQEVQNRRTHARSRSDDAKRECPAGYDRHLDMD